LPLKETRKEPIADAFKHVTRAPVLKPSPCLYQFLYCNRYGALIDPQLRGKVRNSDISCSTFEKKNFFQVIFNTSTHHRNMYLNLAATLLLETDKSIFEIAADIGYSNSGNFGNAFKKRYGVSPIQYRRNGRNALPLQQP
jgi:hypothetical protein